MRTRVLAQAIASMLLTTAAGTSASAWIASI